MMNMKRSGLAAMLLLGGAGLGSAGSAVGDEPQTVLSKEQIQQALAPQQTRSFTPRGLARKQAASSDQSVNLNIPFELNSSALKPQASEQLKQLELALDRKSVV